MQPDFFDNKAKIVKDDLVANISAGDKVSIAASMFSMYAYQELNWVTYNTNFVNIPIVSDQLLVEKVIKQGVRTKALMLNPNRWTIYGTPLHRKLYMMMKA